jgi:hypothetical protein
LLAIWRIITGNYIIHNQLVSFYTGSKSRGFQLGDTHLRAPDRLDRLLLLMALAMYWCVRVGQAEARDHPTPYGKKTQEQTDPHHWTFKKLARSAVSWFKRGRRALQRRLQMQQPLPPFYRVSLVMRN